MIKKLLKEIVILGKEMILIYLYIFLYPIKNIGNFITNSFLIDTLITTVRDLIVIPGINLAFYALYKIFVKPIRLVQLEFVSPPLYSNIRFFQELEKPDIIMKSTLYTFKRLLYNRNNNIGLFATTEHNADNFYTQYKHMRKFIARGWRTIRAISPFYGYATGFKDEVYTYCMRKHRRDFAQFKLSGSFSICNMNLILLFREINRSLVDDSYYMLCLLCYKVVKSNSKNIYYAKEFFNFLKKVYSLLYYNTNLNFKLMSLINFFMKRFIFVNFWWTNSVITRKLFTFYFMKIWSLGEIPVERSIISSEKFGFSGNIYLKYGYFLNYWDVNLVRHEDMFISSSGEDYRYEGESINLVNSIKAIDEFPEDVPLSFNLMGKTKTKEKLDGFGILTFDYKMMLKQYEFFKNSKNYANYNPYFNLKEKPYGFSIPLNENQLKMKYLNNLNSVGMEMRMNRHKLRPERKYRKFFSRKVGRRQRGQSSTKGLVKARFTNRHIQHGHAIKGSTTMFELNHSNKRLINSDIFLSFFKKYKFFKVLYSIFGNLTIYIVKFLNFLGLVEIGEYRNRLHKGTSFFHMEEEYIGVLLVAFVVLLESMFFVFYGINH